MLVRLAVGVIAFACALLCALAASFLVFKMVSEVNKRLPLYPDGNLWRKYRILMALMFASGLVSAWVFGIFGR
jgi:hypothetical protein